MVYATKMLEIIFKGVSSIKVGLIVICYGYNSQSGKVVFLVFIVEKEDASYLKCIVRPCLSVKVAINCLLYILARCTR